MQHAGMQLELKLVHRLLTDTVCLKAASGNMPAVQGQRQALTYPYKMAVIHYLKLMQIFCKVAERILVERVK
jgi:hypothetical protein